MWSLIEKTGDLIMVRIKPNKSCLLLRQECKINIYIISMALDGSKSSFIGFHCKWWSS